MQATKEAGTPAREGKMRRRRVNRDKFLVTLILITVSSAALILGMVAIFGGGNDKSSKKGIGESTTNSNIIGLDETPISIPDVIEFPEDITSSDDRDDYENDTPFANEGEIVSGLEDVFETTTNSENSSEGDIIDDGAQAGVVVNVDVFSRDQVLSWPVTGNVILDFSMERTIYFPTLDLYRCNAGIMIQSEVGTKVLASASGTVTEVAHNEEIGKYIVVDLGGGYTIKYGNLDEIYVKKGDKIGMEGKIGTVAAPTKYFSIEGCNLYLELTKDGTPIDPLDYLKY